MKYTSGDVIAYKINRSKEAYTAAVMLAASGQYFSSVNRLYFAVFYMATAYLKITDGKVKSHSGVRILVHKNLGLTQMLTADEMALYDRLFSNRHEGNYADFVTFDESEVSELVVQTKLLLDKIESLIQTSKP